MRPLPEYEGGKRKSVAVEEGHLYLYTTQNVTEVDRGLKSASMGSIPCMIHILLVTNETLR